MIPCNRAGWPASTPRGSMRKTILTMFLASALVAAPSDSEACLNGVNLTMDDYARFVHRAEKYLDAGNFQSAKRVLGGLNRFCQGYQEDCMAAADERKGP